MDITYVLLAFLLQIIFTIGFIVFFGFLIALCNRIFYANFKSRALTVCYITGFIGTPVHELSHALFCVIFRHKIEEIKLFQINSADGVLGYVNHSYSKKSIYQRIGNFFIGIAPILVISAILYVAAYFLLPDFIVSINAVAHSVTTVSFGTILKNLGAMLSSFFSLAVTWQWWVFLLIGFFLALHMTLSTADIKGALSGILLLLVVLFAVDFILELISADYLTSFTQAVISIGGYLFCFMMISLIISVFFVAISFIARKLIKD